MRIYILYAGKVDMGDFGKKTFKLSELLTQDQIHGDTELELSVQLRTENTNGSLAAEVQLKSKTPATDPKEPTDLDYVGAVAWIQCPLCGADQGNPCSRIPLFGNLAPGKVHNYRMTEWLKFKKSIGQELELERRRGLFTVQKNSGSDEK